MNSNFGNFINMIPSNSNSNNSSEQKNENNVPDNKQLAPPIHEPPLLSLPSPSKSKKWKEDEKEAEEEKEDACFHNNYIVESECSEFADNKVILRLKKDSKVKFVIILIIIDYLLMFYCVD
jgi:hypothetical protein